MSLAAITALLSAFLDNLTTIVIVTFAVVVPLLYFVFRRHLQVDEKNRTMVSRSVDETIERRSECAAQPIRRYLTTDHVMVEDDYSDTQLAELFLHHRVLIVPIATQGTVHAVVTRHDFFCSLVERFGAIAEDRSG